MTWPREVKPREGERPGTTVDQFVVGDTLPELRFTLEPDVLRAYSRAVSADEDGYQVGTGRAVLPSAVAVFLMAVLYRKYPPAQGGVMAGNKFQFFHPIPIDYGTSVVATGRIEETFEKRGRKYVRYSARFMSGDVLLATAENTSTFPSN